VEKPSQVHIERFAEKQLKKLPEFIREALRIWAETIEQTGVRAMRKLPGYHDEPLKGDRAGQRSSRLSRAYRVIYEERETGEVLIIAVLEVNKHDY
jgi:proteic killer suppression protein